jgi:hypothetical protein
MDWGVFSSDVSAIAQADVTKHAREIPIVRRIGIASILLAEHRPRGAQQIALSHTNNVDG